MNQDRYAVDGAVRPDDPDGPEFQGDGQFAPFVIFDIEAQDDGGYGDDYDAVATHWQPLPADPSE